MSSTTFARRLRPARLFPASYPRPSNPATPIHHHHPLRTRSNPHPRSRRFQSSKPPTSPSSSSASASQARQTRRFDALLARTSRWIPRPLRPYLAQLRSAPLSHVAAFLVLHEVTAAVPLLGLAYAFHRADWVPTTWVLGPWAAWAEEGLGRYMRWFRKRGWFGLGDEGEEEDAGREGEERLERRLREEMEMEKERKRGGWLGFWRRKDEGEHGGVGVSEKEELAEAGKEERKGVKAWRKVRDTVTAENTEKGYKIGIQIAAAYAITKALLIPRIALSLWATPWLARGFVTVRRSLWNKCS
ncbi:uncharacterized protein F4812DRAFT_373613 [Daldinia caldariorum]|uniref:uncharacterized protein n=1 Tax=Daldinia caldariorum TaxID=326644 RepID=UPI00200773B6|nr:uncharacterized protein F4812DRAFT_373613 [Daldinia caldariorum]KAI1468573.1 hypothetical protein F4812DRAFT_373613 [Daldinia caldariorum]